MTVIDTNITIEKVKRNKEIHENITVITVLEYSVILAYKKFYGKILYFETNRYRTGDKSAN